MNYADVRRGGRAPIAAVSAKTKYGAQLGLDNGTVLSLAMGLRIERLASAADIEAISGEWEALSARTSPWSPFATPTWNMLWWKHYCNRQMLGSREFFVHVVRGESGRLIGVAPLLLRRIPVIGGLELRAVEFFGTDPSITEIRGVVCELADQPAVLEALRDHFRVAAAEWDLFRWQGIRAKAMRTFNGSAPALTSEEILPDYVLPLPRTFHNLLAGVSSNMRKNVRKAYQLLDRDGHAFNFRAAGAVDGHNGALESFFRLHSARAEVSEMSFKHADRFADTVNRDFIREFVGAMALQGRLRIFELEIAGEIVASRLAFLEGRELYLYYSGYDPAWRQYSVMTTLMAEIMRWAISHKLGVVNLSTSRDLSKLRWRPKEITFMGGLECNSGWRGRVLARTYDAVAMGHRLAYRMSGYRSSS
jgi:CelD/BcsL family acetyltransferase involved in cellulose biosynthesis